MEINGNRVKSAELEVKVRGFRIELTEVEAALAALGAHSVAVGLNVAKASNRCKSERSK